MVCFAKEISFCLPAEPRTPIESVLNTEPAAKRLKRYLLNWGIEIVTGLRIIVSFYFLMIRAVLYWPDVWHVGGISDARGQFSLNLRSSMLQGLCWG